MTTDNKLNPGLEASINRYLERHPVSNVVPMFSPDRLEPRRDEIEVELDEALREYEEIMEGRK